MASSTGTLTSALSPDLVKVREFMLAQVEAGQVESMTECVLGLLARMRDINVELLRRDIARRRAKPPSETWRRLQQELLFNPLPPANENGGATDAATPTGCRAHIVTAELPARAVERGLLGDNLLVEALVEHYGEAVPFERMERRAEEQDVVFANVRLTCDASPTMNCLEREGAIRAGCRALGCLHRPWHRLTRFLDDPLLELTHHEVERDLRTHVLNRKSWYFCGDDASAKRMANALTLIVTCRKLGVPPRAYLRGGGRLGSARRTLTEPQPRAVV